MEQEGQQKVARRPNHDVSIRFNSALTRMSCLGNFTKKKNYVELKKTLYTRFFFCGHFVRFVVKGDF